MTLRIRLRTLLILLALLPAAIGTAWRYQLIHAGCHWGKNYYYGVDTSMMLTNDPELVKYEAWVAWVRVGQLQLEGAGALRDPSKHVNLVWIHRGEKYYRKSFLWSWHRG